MNLTREQWNAMVRSPTRAQNMNDVREFGDALLRDCDRLFADNAEMHAAHEVMTLEVDKANAERDNALAALRSADRHANSHAWEIGNLRGAIVAAQAEVDALRDREKALADACMAVLLFHSVGPWSSDRSDQWRALTGSDDCTTKVMCDLIRAALAPTAKPAEAPQPELPPGRLK